MTKRYYYTCPIKASYMAKYHDIRFKCDIASSFTYYFSHNAMLCDSSERYHIHPDSVHLLEPMEGDLIHIVRGFCSYYKITGDIATGGGKNVTGIWSDGEHWDITIKEPLHDWEIIQRNGQAFHWPESE